MYTQCSHCDTVFQLTAETLRAAGGQVRCGRCGEVFNALARLAEDASAFSAPGESAPGESALEMEARADEILHSPQPNRPPPEPPSDGEDLASADVEFARLQLIEKFKPARQESPGAPRSAALAPGGAGSPRAPPPEPSPGDVPDAGTDAEAADDGALEFTLPPGELDRIFVDPAAARAHPPRVADAQAAAPVAQPADEPAQQAGQRMGSRLDVPEHVRRDVLAGLRQHPLDEPSEPASLAVRLAWGCAAAVLGLLLLGQILHENRAGLAAHGPLRGPLGGLYAALGIKVQPPLNLSAYQLRQWGVTGDPNAAGTLRVRASILNTSAQLQPYPLLRVTLANRFGTRVGTRDFEPAEYLGRPTVRLMTPGERADATLDIHDPGQDAEGFEIDVCLRGPDQAISCAADAATQGKP